MLNGSGQAPGGRDLREFLKRVFKLKTDIANLQRRASRLGTKGDNEETREACKGLIRSLHDECNQLKEKQGQLRQAEGEWDEDRRESYRRTCRELTAHMKAFKDVANFYKERLQQYPHLPSPARAPGTATSTAADAILPQNASSERDAEAEPLQQQQQQQRLASQTEVEFLSAVIDERSEQITDILEDVSELNRMMNEMAQEVDQQGFQLDQFNDNLDNVAADVEMGVGNLASATRYQQRSNRCCCYLMIGAFVFVAALVITLLKLV